MTYYNRCEINKRPEIMAMKVYRLHIRICILAGVMIVVTLACGWSNIEPTKIPTPIEDISVTLEPDPWWVQMLDGRLVNEMGGYEFLGIPGQIPIRDAESFCTNTDDAGFDPQSDLNLLVTGTVSSQPATLEQIYTEAVSELHVDLTAPESIRKDGASGLRAELSRTLPDGTVMLGRFVVVQVNPNQRFVIMGEGSAKAWEAELELLFEAVLASVRFFDPDSQ
jgi:hypothetical protein